MEQRFRSSILELASGRGAGVSLSRVQGGANPFDIDPADSSVTGLVIGVSRGVWHPETCELFERAVRGQLDGSMPVQSALGMDRASRRKERDFWLCEAARSLVTPASPWAKSEKIANEVKAHPRRSRIGSACSPTDREAMFRACVARACETGIDPPVTAKGIYEIIR